MLSGMKIIKCEFNKVRVQLPGKQELWVAGFNIQEKAGEEDIFSYGLSTREKDAYFFTYPKAFVDRLEDFFPAENIELVPVKGNE